MFVTVRNYWHIWTIWYLGVKGCFSELRGSCLLGVYWHAETQRDGTPARSEPNKRRLSDAFIKTVRPDPDRVIVYWDTLQHGLALAVQPSGHRAWKCVYTIRQSGPRWSPWATPGPYRWPTRAGWRAGSWFRSLRVETRTRIGSRCAAGGRLSRWPGATSRSTPGGGTRAGGKWTRLSLSTCHGGPSWTSAASGGQTSRPPSRPSQPRPGEPGSRRGQPDFQLGRTAGNHRCQPVLRRGEEQHDKPRAGAQ